MRASLILLNTIFTPIIRTSATTLNIQRACQRTYPSIPSTLPAAFTYPTCRRLPFSSHTSQDTMTDPPPSQNEALDKMAEPAVKETEILKSEAPSPAEAKDKKTEIVVEEKKEELPKLSAADFRIYNSMAEHMEYFHNHFRQTWTLLYDAASTGRRPASLSLKAFLTTGLQFISHLETHHSIEEMHIFPVLARKMPEFKTGKNAAELLRQHKEIHAGMERFGAYLESCRSGERELVLGELKGVMDSWGEVLWKHLDQEVKTLGAENMRRYWSKEEMRRMPM